MDVSFTLSEIEERDFEVVASQDWIISRCVHVLGFVYGKQEEMSSCVVVPSNFARPVAIEHEEPQA